ncbi:MAG: sulfite exporter TauE/SafE family protein [Burkholderiaceae bacterium]
MMELSLLQAGLSVLSGAVVGFALGLIGGGGSILAVPLLLYIVGMPNAHLAIGTSALAVAANAFASLAQHARKGTVKWPCATVFAVAGVLGALVGSTIGKAIEGDRLLFLFALIMIAVGVTMLMRRDGEGDPSVRITAAIGARLAGIGFLTGLLSGFFGIGGGFLVVPGIMLGSGMAILNAVGSSLLSVGAFGTATAANYAISGLVDWPVAGLFIVGGVAGGALGMRLAVRLASRKGMLTRIFAGVIFAVAAYMLYKSAGKIFSL